MHAKTILHVRSSIDINHSASRALGDLLLADLQQGVPSPRVVVRDLVEAPPRYIDTAFFDNLFTPDSPERTGSVELLDELLSAGLLVIEAPMYNFSIPATLKSWFDHVVRRGITFRFGSSGFEGLLQDKAAILLLSSGGLYTDTPRQPMDHQEPYLRTILGFMGIQDVTSIRAEGLAMGGECRQAAMKEARTRVQEVARRWNCSEKSMGLQSTPLAG